MLEAPLIILIFFFYFLLTSEDFIDLMFYDVFLYIYNCFSKSVKRNFRLYLLVSLYKVCLWYPLATD